MAPKPPRRSALAALAVALLLCGLAILGTLGTWQASRFIDRLHTFSLREQGQAAPPVELTSAAQLTLQLDFRRVTLIGGSLLMPKTIVVERRFHKHLPGDWVVTPYQFGDGSIVLVHTGWIPENREDLIGNTPLALGGLVVSAPTRADKLARAEGALSFDTPPRLGELDATFLYEQFGKPSPSNPHTIVVLTGEVPGLTYPTPSHEYVTKPYLTPAVHLGYAVLWYGSGLLLMWLFWAGWTGRLDPSAR